MSVTKSATPTQIRVQSESAKMAETCAGLETKSAKIRALTAAGYKKLEVATYLGISFQHVRNVLVTPLKGKGA